VPWGSTSFPAGSNPGATHPKTGVTARVTLYDADGRQRKTWSEHLDFTSVNFGGRPETSLAEREV